MAAARQGQRRAAASTSLQPDAGPAPDRVVTAAIRLAAVLALALAVAQFVDYGVFDLRIRALNSNTHASVFGAVSLIVNLAAVSLAISLAARVRSRALLLLAGALAVMLALRVTKAPHIVVVSLPFTGTALLILWRQAGQAAQRERRAIRAGCSFLVLSFAIHASELISRAPFALDADSWAYQVRCVFKHDAELAGWILISAGLVNLLIAARDHGSRRAARHALAPPVSPRRQAG
jgi:hypothetical protein